MRTFLYTAALAACALLASAALSARLPEGYWSEKQSQRVLDKTLTIRLDPAVSHLSASERDVVRILLEAGGILHALYLDSRHYQSSQAYAELRALDAKLAHPRATRNLLDLYRLFKGPIGRGLDNKVVPFLPVENKAPGRNVYPWGIAKQEIEDYLDAYPEERESILGVRTVVRRATRENLQQDIERLEGRYKSLQIFYPDLVAELSARLSRKERGGFYAIPYALAYADGFMKVSRLLQRAAALIEETDADFARYLRHRAIDLLSNDYEAGDASWVTGRFGNLNAQIGAYETYDDELYGTKSFLSLSLLVKDREMTSSLNTVVKWLQEFEDRLPYDARKRVRDDIPIGVYNVIADFGQARGTNTATILPNESYITRKYGRTILIRRNILEDPDLFQIRKDAFEAAVVEDFHQDYRPYGDFFRTLFHEIGHYLGVDLTRDGRTLDIALEEDSSILEELKADLVALYLAKYLYKRGYYNDPRLRAVQAAGIRRVLRKNQPKKSQVYATMQLMQMNYFLEQGLLEYEGRKRLRIHRDKYHPVVESMLREVLALQYEGDKAAADRFIEKYSTWDKNLHERIAKSMKKSEAYRYALVRYAAMGE